MQNGNIGQVSQVIGSTLDARFPEDRLPAIYNALKANVERTVLGETVKETLWCEVAQHLGGGQVRAVALGSTDGLQRGADILDTGEPVTVPVDSSLKPTVKGMQPVVASARKSAVGAAAPPPIAASASTMP